MLARSLLATSLLLACGGGKDSAPTPGSAEVTAPKPGRASKADCKRAVDHMRKLDQTKSVAIEASKDSPLIKKAAAEMSERRSKFLLDHCISTPWPTAMVSCMTSATDFEQSEKCAPIMDTVLTQPQIKALNDGFDRLEGEAMAAMQKLIDAELVGIKALRDRMCACTDAACRKAVDRDLEAAKRPTDTVVTPQYEPLASELEACRK